MAIQTQDAVLLRKRDYRETSFILTYFTKDFGKVHGILKGARGARSRSNLNPLFFSVDQIVFYEKKKSDLYIISQCESQELFLDILKGWDSSSAAYYILELVDLFTEPGEKIEEIFEGLRLAFSSLNTRKEPHTITRLFEVRLLMALGLWPGVESFKLSKGSLSTLMHFERDTWQNSSKIKLTQEVGEEIQKVTGEIITHNLDRPLKTKEIFNTI